MPSFHGFLKKMHSQYGEPVEYTLQVGDESIHLNSYLNNNIRIEFLNKIYCVQCKRKTKKSFQQGHCYPCFLRLKECNFCILHPEKCLVEQGQCAVDDWAHHQCHGTQIVYLAHSSGLKVGITRETQVPTRWIDQGATQAIPLFRLNNRYQVGLVEVLLKEFISDRTNWRKMLKNDLMSINLNIEKENLLQKAESKLKELQQTVSHLNLEYLNGEIVNINYPVLDYPKKIVTLDLDQTAAIEGKLLGIKGQYLILDIGVLNIRKFGGYEVQVQF